MVAKNAHGRSDSYVEICALSSSGEKIGKAQTTKVVKSSLNPRWEDTLEYERDVSRVTGLRVRVWDKHRFRADKFMGQLTIKFNPAKLADTDIDEWFALQKRSAKEPVSGEVKLVIRLAGVSGAGAAARPAVSSGGAAVEPSQSTLDLKVSASYSDKSTDDALSNSTHVVVEEDEDSADFDDGASTYDGPGGAIDDYDRLREGPAATVLAKLSKEEKAISLSGKNLEFTNSGSAAVDGWARANVAVSAQGIWQFEMKVVNAGQMQIGWATTDFRPHNTAASAGSSWTYDGSRQQKIKGGTQSERYGDYWSTGDIITCVLDIPKKSVSYWRNGNAMGVAHNDISVSSPLMPVVAAGRRAKAVCNFGKADFAHPQKGAYALHSNLTNKNLAELAGMYHSFEERSNRAAVQEAVEEADDDDSKAEEAVDFDKLTAEELEGLADRHEVELKDAIHGTGMLFLQEQLTGKMDEEDPVMFLVAFHLKCEHLFEISKEEWMNGWSLNGCHTPADMQRRVRRWRQALTDDTEFRPFYNFVFDYLKEDPAKKILDIDTVTLAWNSVLNGTGRSWPLLDQFIQFLNEEDKKAVGRDAWLQLFHLMRDHKDTMDGYDDAGSWPTLYDEFAEWFQAQKLKAAASGKNTKDEDSSSSSSSSDD